MTLAQRQEINRLAETIREGLALELPVDIEEAVVRLGGTIELAKLDDKVDALVKKDGERFKIIIHKGKPLKRRRFSVAHELGHLFLHMGYLLNPDKWTVADEYRDSVYFRYGHGTEEDEASEFAAAFLMPADEFREVVLANGNSGGCSLEKIAEFFDTSTSAVSRRGRILGLLKTG